MSLLLLFLAAPFQTFATGYPQLPPQLFSPLIAEKLLANAQITQGIPSSYPQYTTPDTGVWRYFGADTWTSGFLPATYYALAERAAICPHTLNGTTTSQWLAFGRSSATGEIPLEVHTTVGHDVGFLSFPFVDELSTCALPSHTTLSISVLLSRPHQRPEEQNSPAIRRGVRRCISRKIQPYRWLHAQLGHGESGRLRGDH